MIALQKSYASWINKPSAISSAISMSASLPLKTPAGSADRYPETSPDCGGIGFVTIA